MAVYTFGDWDRAKKQNPLLRTSGRTQLPTKLKNALIEKYGCRCNLYGEEYPERLLQPDHRIPFEIGGDPDDMMDTSKFMLLCPSANRDKSWACEHCRNWKEKDVTFCQKCYYAYPEHYTHIAGEEERKIDIVFKGKDLILYDEAIRHAKINRIPTEDFVKRAIEYLLRVK